MHRRVAVGVVMSCLVAASCVSSSEPDIRSDSADPVATGTTDPTTRNADITGAPAEVDELALTSVSTRADYVSGGDVLVRLAGPSPIDPATASLASDDGPVVVDWSTDDDGSLVGLVEGLAEGSTTLTASVGDVTADLVVTNHPLTGPLFSGPHLPLAVCTTEANGLGPALDDDCSAETVIDWRHHDGDTWVDVASADDVPADRLAVRRERGTLNRSVYWMHLPEEGWNGRLVYVFGGGCGTSYSQGFRLFGEPDPALLEAGYATVTATFNTFQVMCNDVLSAETALMVKEHFAETYGPPEITIGMGGSGGAIQQYLIAQNYPGILDAVGAIVPFPDAMSIAPDVVDCGLMQRFFAEGGAEWDPEAQRAVTGHLDVSTCGFWNTTFVPVIDPTSQCSLRVLSQVSDDLPEGLPAIGEDEIYDPETNPDGIRCTMQDANRNVLGLDPETGFARRPLDSVGVQYGLAALNDGAISFDQFVQLNTEIGSWDIDGTWVPERFTADEDAIRTVYETGRVIDGSGDLRRIPIISVDVWTDPQGDIHDRVRLFTIEERLRRDDGSDPANHAIWTRDVPEGETLVDSLTGSLDLGPDFIRVLDEWATAVAAERTPDMDESELDALLARTRPDAASDNCVLADGTQETGPDVYEPGTACAEAFPISSTPRLVAGTPLSNDIGKCQLQTLDDAAAAGVWRPAFDDDQRATMSEVFPTGVCDWTLPGVGQVAADGEWRDYGA